MEEIDMAYMVAQRKLSSVQRRLLSEQEKSGNSTLDTELGEMVPDAQPIKQSQPEGKTDSMTMPSEQDKAQKAIKAIEKLQDAAVSLEAARFAIAQAYSDFSTAGKLERLKQELVSIISKAREHVMHSSAKSPEADKIVSQWLKL